MSYEALCTETDCFEVVREDDIERDFTGNIYERSKKCWDCRTKQNRLAIKKWRSKQKKNWPSIETNNDLLA